MCLASFTLFGKFIHVVCSCNVFIVVVVYIILRIYHSVTDGRLGSFYFLVIKNKAALNIFEYVFSPLIIYNSFR